MIETVYEEVNGACLRNLATPHGVPLLRSGHILGKIVVV